MKVFEESHYSLILKYVLIKVALKVSNLVHKLYYTKNGKTSTCFICIFNIVDDHSIIRPYLLCC